MALAYETEVLRGKEQSVIKVEEGKVISVSGLIKWDIDTLNKVNDSIDGDTITTFKQAFEAFEVRQGVTAAQYYANHVITVAEYNEGYTDPTALVGEVETLKGKVAANELAVAGIGALEGTVAGQEARIAANELAVADVPAIEGRVGTLETDYTALEGRVTAVEA